MSQWQLPSCESLRKMKKPLNSGRTNERALLLASDCASFRLFMLPLTLYVCTCMFNRCSRYLFHLQNADGKPLEGTDEDYEGAVWEFEEVWNYVLDWDDFSRCIVAFFLSNSKMNWINVDSILIKRMPFTLDSLTFCDFQLKFDCLGLVTEALDLISLILILSLLSGSITSSLPPVASPPAAPIQSTPTAGIQRIRVPAGVAPEHAISGARDEVRGL